MSLITPVNFTDALTPHAVTLTVKAVSVQLQFGLDILPVKGFPPEKEPSFRINAGMLTLAREAKGYTQKDLAEQINCTPSRLSKIEAGELLPHEGDLQKFVEVLSQTWDFFFQRGAAIPAGVSFYRKIQTLPQKTLRQCNAQMNICRLQIEQQVGQKKLGRRDLPSLSAEKHGGPKAVAQKVRREWDVKKGPLPHLTERVEDAGCVIVDYWFPTAKLDGLCIRAPHQPAVIFLNSDLPKSRRRLSLAHELGHLVMHTHAHENVENEAWEFAEEFLMPSAEIAPQLDNLTLDKLGRLKMEWGVSMQAILYRAKKLGKLSAGRSRFLWMQIGKQGYRVNEPFEEGIPDERPAELELRLKKFTES